MADIVRGFADGHKSGDSVVTVSSAYGVGASGAAGSRSPDGNILLWDLASGSLITRISTGWADTASLAFSRDGKYLAAGNGKVRFDGSWFYNGAVRVWSVQWQQKVTKFGIGALVADSVGRSLNTSVLLSTSYNHEFETHLGAWKWPWGEMISRLLLRGKGEEKMKGANFSPSLPSEVDIDPDIHNAFIRVRDIDVSSQYVLTVYRCALLWDAVTMQVIKKLDVSPRTLQCGKISPSAKFLVTGGGESHGGFSDSAFGGYLQLWNVKGELLRQVDRESRICSVAWVDDRSVLFGDETGKVGIWQWEIEAEPIAD